MRNDRQHYVVEVFRQADRILKRVIDKRVEGTGVYRSQHRLLMSLGNNPDCSQTELAEKLEVSPAAVAVSLKKLEKSGYISRESDADDNRMNHVIVTAKGKEAIRISIVYFQEMENAILKGFTMEELAFLQNCFERMIQNGEAYYHMLLNEEKK